MLVITALHPQRCIKIHEEMFNVLSIYINFASTNLRTNKNYIAIDLITIGNQHYRTHVPSKGRTEVHHCCFRLLYQVDGGGSLSNTSSIWKAVVYQFGISRVFIFDNGQYLDSNYHCNWCDVVGIKVKYCSPGTPLILKPMDKLRRSIRL